MIDEIYRTKQCDGHLNFEAIADGLGFHLGEIFEEIYPGYGRDLVTLLLTPGTIGDIDWADDKPGVLTITGNENGEVITITDEPLVNLIPLLCGLLQYCAWHADGQTDAAWRHLVGFSQIVAKIRADMRAIEAQARLSPGVEMSDVKNIFAVYGVAGAKKKHEPARLLKRWALDQSKNMRGADADIARKLVAHIPSDLADVSKNPERFIYDAIRAARNKFVN